MTNSSRKRATTMIENENDVPPEQEKLCLDQFLKLTDVVSSGGQAKYLIQNGGVQVNGEIETRRRRKLVAGDIVEADGQRFRVTDPSVPEASSD